MPNPDSFARKIMKAWVPLEKVFDAVEYDLQPSYRWGSINAHVTFTYEGNRYRWDWSADCINDKIPTVGYIRDLVWTSMGEYRRVKQGLGT